MPKCMPHDSTPTQSFASMVKTRGGSGEKVTKVVQPNKSRPKTGKATAASGVQPATPSSKKKKSGATAKKASKSQRVRSPSPKAHNELDADSIADNDEAVLLAEGKHPLLICLIAF